MPNKEQKEEKTSRRPTLHVWRIQKRAAAKEQKEKKQKNKKKK